MGATLVVAPFAIIHYFRPQQGDHKGRPKGRPYIILKVAFHDAPISSDWLKRATALAVAPRVTP